MTALATSGDWMSLGDFASWLRTSQVVAKDTLDELDIAYVRIGARGMYRISTASVAEAFGVQMPTNDDDAPSEAVIAKPHLEGSAVVNALTTEAVRHVSG